MTDNSEAYICFGQEAGWSAYQRLREWVPPKHLRINFEPEKLAPTRNLQELTEEDNLSIARAITRSQIFVVLVGSQNPISSPRANFEIDCAVQLGIPILIVNLDGSRERTEFCPKNLRNSLAVHISFEPGIFWYALEYWPTLHRTNLRRGVVRNFVYEDNLYLSLLP